MSAVADLIVRRLLDSGTRALFGVPGGGGNLDLIDAAGRLGLPFVLTSTETAAAIAAIAQSEITAAPGACLTTLGPGAASVVNGVACAHLERAPIAIFTDSHATSSAGAFLHQQIDHRALLAPVTKWSEGLEPGSAGRTIDEAFHALGSMPPGPVHIDCPGDVSEPGETGAVHAQRSPDSTTGWGFDFELARPRRPLLLIGLGARQADAAGVIRRLCERAGVPALVTYKAKGVVPDSHPWYAGVFTNAAIERDLLEESDLLIGVGLDPVELLPRPWSFTAPILGIAPWRMSDAHVPFAAQLVSDLGRALTALEQWLGKSAWEPDRALRHARAQRDAVDIPADRLTAPRIVDIAARALAGSCRVTVDAGAHMFPATLRWPVSEPNGLLISNGLSTMGFALPAAIGAALLDREPVVALTGDGGLLMCAGELLTAARERLRVITIVFNDSSLSLIEIKQQARRLRPSGVALGAVRWRRLAESFGVASFGAATEDELGHAIEGALAVNGPSLIEATVDGSNYGAMMRALRG